MEKKANFSFKKFSSTRNTLLNKSSNTTIATVRNSFSTIRPKRKCTTHNFQFISYTDFTSESGPSKYCFAKAIDLFTQEKFSFAMQMFQKVLDLEPSNYKVRNNLGICHAVLKNLNEAIECFNEAIRIDRTVEASYFNVALAYLNFDKTEEAYLCLKSAKPIIAEPSEQFKRLEEFIVSYGKEKKQRIFSGKIYRKLLKIDQVLIKNYCNVSVGPKVEEDLTEGFHQASLDNKTSENNAMVEAEDIEKKEIIKLRDSVFKDRKRLARQKLPEPEQVPSKNMTQQELSFVKVEFSKEDAHRDYEKLDLILEKLMYFSKFDKNTRRKIYAVSEVVCFLPNEVIFKQGDIGENMYVILKGAITIEKKGKEFGDKNIVINSIYDGKQFGELALLNALNFSASKNERTASCIAFEKTYLLCMPKKDITEIVLMSNKAELDYATNFLSKVSLFKGFSSNSFIAIASNIDKLSFKLNEIILKKGEYPRGLYMISKGYAVLYTEGFTVKDKYLSEHSPIRKQKPQPSPMYFSVTPPPKSSRVKKFTLASAAISKNSLKREELKSLKNFLTKEEINKVNQGHYLVQDKLPFTSLKEFDFFGGRAILEGSIEGDYKNSPSKFTITAQSTHVEVFLLTRYHLQFLTQEMVLQLMTILGKSFEIDCPPEVNPKEMDKLFKNWQKFKCQLIKDIHNDSFINRKKSKGLLTR